MYDVEKNEYIAICVLILGWQVESKVKDLAVM